MTTVVSVRFRSGCKTYFFDPRELTVEAGQDIIVETAQGPEFAQCSQGNHEVPDQQVVQPLRAVLRIATDNDRHTAAYNRGREKEAFEICRYLEDCYRQKVRPGITSLVLLASLHDA